MNLLIAFCVTLIAVQPALAADQKVPEKTVAELLEDCRSSKLYKNPQLAPIQARWCVTTLGRRVQLDTTTDGERAEISTLLDSVKTAYLDKETTTVTASSKASSKSAQAEGVR